MLCYAMLCYAMLCYAMLCYAMLWYAMLCCSMLCSAMLCSTMPCHAMLCPALPCPALLCYAMYAVLCYAKLCYFAMLHVCMLCWAVPCYVLPHLEGSHVNTTRQFHHLLVNVMTFARAIVNRRNKRSWTFETAAHFHWIHDFSNPSRIHMAFPSPCEPFPILSYSSYLSTPCLHAWCA